MTGKYYINNIDSFSTYGAVFNQGTFNELMKPFPAWPNDTKKLALPVMVIGNNEVDFWNKYNLLINVLSSGEDVYLRVTDLKNKEFRLSYENISNFSMRTFMKSSNKVFCSLILNMIDDYPDLVVSGIPTVNAGIDKSLTLPTNSITLNGAATGSGITIEWTKISGGAATIVSPNNPVTVVSGLESGSYVFRLTVTDFNEVVVYDEATITVALPAAPTVSAGIDRIITLPTDNLTVTATQTGTGVTVVWSKVSGGAATITSSTSLTTSITGLVDGEYVFRVTATDSFGRTATDDMSLTVQEEGENQAPVVNAGSDQTITLPAGLTLTGTATDADGTIASTVWTKISGGAATITNPNNLSTTVTGLAAGSYVFRLTATDNLGATGYDEISITVQAANVAPTVNAGTDQSITLPTNSITLVGTASDSDGSIASTTWTKISGGAATITNPNSLTTTVTGMVAGSYQFRLTATDNLGATTSDDISITVASGSTGVFERFDFGPSGLATTAGYTPLRGNPETTLIEATGLNGGVIKCGNYEYITGLYGVGAAFDTGFTSALTYLDHNGVSQTVPQSVMKGLWSNWLNDNRGPTITGLTPGASYYITLWASIIQVGGFTSTENNKVKYVVTGATTHTTDGTYNFYQNNNDTVDGLRITMTANSSGEIKVGLGWGNGQTLAGILNALEVRSV